MDTQDLSAQNQSSPSPFIGGKAPIQTMSLEQDIQRREQQLEGLKGLKELKEAARPLMEYLKQYHHSHCSAVVDTGSVEIVEGIRQIQF